MKIKLPNQKIFREKQRVFQKNPINFFNGQKSDSYKNFTLSQKNMIVIEGQSGESSIGEICIREGITPATFYQWTQDFLQIENKKIDSDVAGTGVLSEDDRFRIVIEGKTGETSIAEICKREQISQDTFLQWSREFLEQRRLKLDDQKDKESSYLKNKLLFEKFSDPDVFHYLENFIDFSDKRQLIISDENSIKLDEAVKFESVIALKRINDVRYINKFFEKVNSKLPEDGLFVGCLETFTARKERKNINRIPIIRDVYFFSEFILKRIIPKLSFTKGVYFDITKGNDRLLSKAEGLGRLVSSGFKIMDHRSINGLVYFVVKKVKDPSFDANPSYGPVYKMPRIGKNGRTIKVYKLRTMHPYSEYLQDYVLRSNGYAKTGKPADDFRIPAWGKFIRRFWLDELPQLINVFKGDMKLVGIRPVSERYFQDIPKEMQKLRLTQKPGCIPPYVALNRDANVMSVLQAEKEYLEEKIRNPYYTDTKYFFKAIFNIIFKHKRSA
jgi:lipopolysaccharide/colanic/teichoic acid biosynthesis glycosyltransferase/transposase-like protein